MDTLDLFGFNRLIGVNTNTINTFIKYIHTTISLSNINLPALLNKWYTELYNTTPVENRLSQIKIHHHNLLLPTAVLKH